MAAELLITGKEASKYSSLIHRSADRFALTMNWSGRISVAATFGIIPRLFCVYAYIDTFSPIAVSEHGVPIEVKFWDTKRTPLAHMVDVTNEFGLKVLAEHNFLNDNNIAFSPYGLMGILVALYEGVDGESSYQIQRSMQLPWNRNIMRIGFRDIHRTLKTYFVPEEGFLAGLALNNENVTFSDSYRKILRFYGFDLQSDPLPTPPEVNTTDNLNATTSATDSLASNGVTENDPEITSEQTSTAQPTLSAKEKTTIATNFETINGTDDSQSPTTASAANSESTSEITSTLQMETTETTTQVSSSELNMSTVTTSAPTTDPLTTMPTISTTDEMLLNKDVEILSTQTTIMSSDSTTSLDTSSTLTTDMESTASTMTEIQSMDEMTTLESTTATLNNSTLETLERRKKSIVDFIFTSPPNIDDYVVYRSFNIGPDLPDTEGYNTDSMFMVNGLRNIQVSYMHYDTVLEHAYLPHLEASALRLPLDSERYYLLVVLPVRAGKGELERLLARMARESDLSDVYAALRPRRVRAVVPSFTVKGHVTLTTDLQKLGVRDVFEPRQRDFTPMTSQPGVYVRSIEQAVSVTIRKYQPDDAKRYVSKRNPVLFSATYPFLYFVMDSSIQVSLMAGKMVDPLNTRIL
ncbi:uncharacterized protein LOC123703386 [Colias croceus]|uniref:uncharacterized protein LOC123703386 n=1 Tax=Colias crocea TaxID=72248 RepID=UPI001E27DB50|nr:uncharacterized protein LOC123703386 [Colias croceus]